jgi:DNA helicase-2/ATP-dependent DNA helicase PcrA
VRRLDGEDTPDARSRVENVEELVTSVFTFEENTPDATLASYLDQITLVAAVDSLEETPDRVVLMTVHSAKGLEFPVVFIAGMEEGLFPHGLSQQDPDSIEEERRLCYVGMTRAKDRLYLTRAAARRVFGSLRFNDPSRFFDEIPPEFVQVTSPPGGGEWRDRPQGSAPRTVLRRRGGEGASRVRDGERRIDYAYDQTGEHGEDREMPLSDLADVRLERGTRVRHPNLGLGAVERVEGEGRRARVVIRFERGGVRTFMLAYAELEIV